METRNTEGNQQIRKRRTKYNSVKYPERRESRRGSTATGGRGWPSREYAPSSVGIELLGGLLGVGISVIKSLPTFFVFCK